MHCVCIYDILITINYTFYGDIKLMEHKKILSLHQNSNRLGLLDLIRGITVISMVLYHAVWDLVYIFRINIPFFHGTAAYIWQQSICITFILLSGFCFPLSKRPVKNGLVVFAAGIIISIITALLMPENIIIFGVLTLIGSSMLLTSAFDKALKKIPAAAGILIFFILFFFTRNINDGNIGFESLKLFELPEILYSGYAASYIGFTDPGFISADYFSLIPWFFLFVCGYFLHKLILSKGVPKVLTYMGFAPVNFIGRHSLIIYMIHQPVVYGILYLLLTILPSIC